jgi:hypothetical protein
MNVDLILQLAILNIFPGSVQNFAYHSTLQERLNG